MEGTHRAPILLLVSDLYFTSRIEGAARHLGYPIVYTGANSPAEFQAQLLELQPALVVLDLNQPNLDWAAWLAAAKGAPATAAFPVLAFGSHMDVDSMSLAKKSGAEAVLAKSRFTADMPELLQKYARQPG